MKLALIASAALSALIAAAPAHATWSNGTSLNGVKYNGIISNGIISNGLITNGLMNNGLMTNSVSQNSTLVQSIASARPITCVTGAEPVCEQMPALDVQSVTLGNGTKLETH